MSFVKSLFAMVVCSLVLWSPSEVGAGTVGRERVIASASEREESFLHSLKLKDGRVLYTWAQSRDEQDTGYQIIKGRTYDPETDTFGPIRTLADARVAGGLAVQPWGGVHEIVLLKDGDVAFFWYEQLISGQFGAESLWVRRLSPDLARKGAAVRLAVGSIGDVQAEVTRNGRIAVVWSYIYATDGSVHAAVLTPDFKPAAKEVEILAEGQYPEISVAVADANLAVVAYTSTPPQGAPYRVRARFLNTVDGAVSGTKVLVSDLHYQRNFFPVVNPVHPSGFVISWDDFDRSIRYVRAKFFDAGGTAKTPALVLDSNDPLCEGLQDARGNPPVVQLGPNTFAALFDEYCGGGIARRLLQTFTTSGKTGAPTVVRIEREGRGLISPLTFTLTRWDGKVIAAYPRAPRQGETWDANLFLRVVTP